MENSKHCKTCKHCLNFVERDKSPSGLALSYCTHEVHARFAMPFVEGNFGEFTPDDYKLLSAGYDPGAEVTYGAMGCNLWEGKI